MKKVRLTTATLAILAGAMSAPMMTNAEESVNTDDVSLISEEKSDNQRTWRFFNRRI